MGSWLMKRKEKIHRMIIDIIGHVSRGKPVAHYQYCCQSHIFKHGLTSSRNKIIYFKIILFPEVRSQVVP